MKINVVYIGLAFCLAGCGGGGGSNAVGAPVLSPAPIEFSDGSTLLGEDTMRVEINGVLRTLAAPDWQNNLAQHTSIDESYVARRDTHYVAVAGRYDDQSFAEVLGNFEPITQFGTLRYNGNLNLRTDNSELNTQLELRINFASVAPRLTTVTPVHGVDVAASINSDGTFSNGFVTYGTNRADMRGGFFDSDPNAHNDSFIAAFAGDGIYGTLLGQIAD